MADGTSVARKFDIQEVRSEFPILAREVNGKPLVYLDSAASAQKPRFVIDALSGQMETAYANVHRGLHTLANETTSAMEAARESARAFLNAGEVDEIIFTKGATEGINLVANGLVDIIKPGDEIVLSVMEHHSNIVPWHFLRERCGAVLKWVPLLEDGSLDVDAYDAALSDKTRLVAITHMSNVLGTVTPIRDLAAKAHACGAEILVDGCQAAVHLNVDVQALDVDYYVFSAHKLYGPTGIGILYGKRRALEALRPYQGGGEMIETVTMDSVTYGDIPHKFEAGTPPILEAIALGAAIRWFSVFDHADVHAHEAMLHDRAAAALRQINRLKIHGTAPEKGSVLTFSVEGAHPHDISQILDKYGVAIRAGHHCAQPLMTHLGVSATARASFGIYNTLEDVDQFVTALDKTLRMLG
ncbi:aminotransferase class V-fold PLP-dependent enzyme [Ponticaulis sp.]|uniref:aminotransferase class V-fold PLP-dependent enzyme n=1 Tax=Ponticaulis sp. TaxID=2020902 RepID=UPI000B742BFD|nr:cysteine desulfurase [Ponticaulis sp.]MAI89534.1 cysteine desulfurase [Ponticaulis sp.]OUY00566.1 MAG: cysteine desulfurase [Hyphomonadaceae bacterium TMED5]|tara:strand:+ start:11863 stop:13104 length:1242 start_codon:yes stop_codon:yes gene_type:complete